MTGLQGLYQPLYLVQRLNLPADYDVTVEWE